MLKISSPNSNQERGERREKKMGKEMMDKIDSWLVSASSAHVQHEVRK